MPPLTARPLAAINPLAARPRNGNVWFSPSILRPSQFAAAASLSISPLRTLRAISSKQMFQTGFFSAQITFCECLLIRRTTLLTLASQSQHFASHLPIDLDSPPQRVYKCTSTNSNPKLIGVPTLPASYVGLCGDDFRTLARQTFAGVISRCLIAHCRSAGAGRQLPHPPFLWNTDG
jgi:hypothetical protein